MSLRVLCFVASAWLVPAPAAAQTTAAQRECGETSTIPFARVAMRRLCRLADDSTIHAATGATDAMSLLGKTPQNVLWRVPDDALTNFMAAFGESLGSVPDSVCADIYPHPGSAPWSERFMSVAQGIDSAMAERWTDFLEAWVWVTVHNTPIQPQATAPQAVAYVRAQWAHTSPAEQADMRRMVQGQPISSAAACHVVRLSFLQYASGTPAEAAAALRAMMNGLAPWLVAT